MPGRRYRIEDRIDANEPHLLGTFVKSYGYPIRRQNRIITEVSTLFNDITQLDGRRIYEIETSVNFDTDTYIFYEAAESIIANQVARGLSGSISEKNAYLVRQYLQGKDPPGKGVNRFPARSRKNRKYRKNRKSRKH